MKPCWPRPAKVSTLPVPAGAVVAVGVGVGVAVATGVVGEAVGEALAEGELDGVTVAEPLGLGEGLVPGEVLAVGLPEAAGEVDALGLLEPLGLGELPVVVLVGLADGEAEAPPEVPVEDEVLGLLDFFVDGLIVVSVSDGLGQPEAAATITQSAASRKLGELTTDFIAKAPFGGRSLAMSCTRREGPRSRPG